MRYGLLAVCLITLAGCGGRTESMTDYIKKVQTECRGQLTIELQVSGFPGADHLKVTCTEDVSDEARAKKSSGK